MSIPHMDLKGCYPEIYEEVSSKIKSLIDSTSFIGGEEVTRFEAEYAEFCSVKHAIACANGTDAIMISLKALEIGPGDIVLTVPNTFIATAEAISAVGARVDFIDIDEDSYTMSPRMLSEYLLNCKEPNRVKAVIPVHLYGQMADMPEIVKIARDFNLKIIEDSAQAHGAKINGKGPGEFGDVATFSFYPGKNLGAFGDAGAIITNDTSFAKRIKMLTDHGRTKKYEHEIEGYNGRMDTIQAAVLRIKLRYLNKWTDMRIEKAGLYSSMLSDIDVKLPWVIPNRKHVFHLYVIRTNDRDKLVDYLSKNAISTGIHYPIPLHLQPAFSYLGYKQGDFPISEKASNEIVSLPFWPEITQQDISFIANQIISFKNQLN